MEDCTASTLSAYAGTVGIQPYLKKLCYLILFIAITALITGKAQADTFKPLTTLPPQVRVPMARDIYKATCRKIPRADAMRKLDSLAARARSLADLPLECAVYELRADYCSVNYGFGNAATSWYDGAIAFAVKENLKLEQGIYIHKKAVYYSVYKRNAAACQYFLDAQEIFSQLGYQNVPDIGIYLWEFAEFYYGIGDYDECSRYLDEGLQYNVHSLRNRINMTNTIGLIYRNRKQYPQSLSIFNRVLNMATIGKDTAWIGIAKGNIGSVYFMQKNYTKALPYIQADYDISLKYNESLNGAISLLRLARISLETNKLDQADKQLIATNILLNKDKTNILKYYADLYQLKATYYERVNNLKQALVYREKFENTKDSVVKQDNITAVDRVALRWEIDKHLIQLNQLKANSQITTLKWTGIITLLLLAMVAFIWIYSRKIRRAKKDNEALLSEKTNIDEELKSAITALMIYTENLKQKNEIIEQFRKKIEQMQVHISDEAELEKLDKLVQNHIMTDETWNEFKKLFSKVHTRFFQNLAAQYPNISVTDTRLLSLVKLGLNNREMANMLGITIEGIKKAKQRLRKKMNIGPDVEIEKIISEL